MDLANLGQKLVQKENIINTSGIFNPEFLSFHDNPGSNRKLSGDKDFEKAIMKIEYLHYASLYTEDENKRRELLEDHKSFEILAGVLKSFAVGLIH
jgi:hypothetical protein